MSREGEKLPLHNRHFELYLMWRVDEVAMNSQMPYELHSGEFDIPSAAFKKAPGSIAGRRRITTETSDRAQTNANSL